MAMALSLGGDGVFFHVVFFKRFSFSGEGPMSMIALEILGRFTVFVCFLGGIAFAYIDCRWDCLFFYLKSLSNEK